LKGGHETVRFGSFSEEVVSLTDLAKVVQAAADLTHLVGELSSMF
jgi:hypothetical protein